MDSAQLYTMWRQLGQLENWGQSHLRACSLTCLAADADCRLRPQLRPSAGQPTHGLYMWLFGLLTAWWLGSKAESECCQLLKA